MPTRKTIRVFRKHLDGIVKDMEDLTNSHQPNPHSGLYTLKGANISKPIEEAIEHVVFAKAWLGKVCEARGYAYPYGSGYENVSEIVTTANVAEFPLEGPRKKPTYVGQMSDMCDHLGYAIAYPSWSRILQRANRRPGRGPQHISTYAMPR